MNHLNDSPLPPDDPRLTAYALGELEPAEHAAVEAALRHDPAARAAAEEIRALGAQLAGALAAEARHSPEGESESLPRAAIVHPAYHGWKSMQEAQRKPGARLFSFPRAYFLVGGLAAACFAVLVALHTPPKPAPEQPTYTRLVLAPLPNAEPASAEAAAKPADALAPTTVTVNLPPVSTDAVQAPPPPAGATLGGNLTLLAQAKEQDAARRLGGAGLAGSADQAAQIQNWKQERPGDLALRNEPVVLAAGGVIPAATGGRSAAPAQKTAVNSPAFARGLRSSGTGEGKKVAEARAPGVKPVAPAPAGSLFEQAVRQRNAPQGVVNGGLTFGAAGNVAMNRLDGRIFSENRGLAGYAATDLDAITARGSGAPDRSGDRYADVRDNDFLGAAQNRLSTFAVDVDTASYANVRGFLRDRQRPPREAVRIEELVNYFPYRYTPPPPASEAPFAASLEIADAPWAPTHRLVRIGLKGRELSTATRPAANLVFLLDVSGSMNAPNRLPLVKESMRLLVGRLRPDDHVAIVTYAGNSGLALASTPVARTQEILSALDRLSPGGSTNGGMGIQLAYDIAKANFVAGGINRVILCTDGDFNVGVTGEGALTRLIEEKAKSGVALTALGFGMGNLKDATIEKLADHGNGNYGYIDSRREAEKLLVEQVNSTLVTIAKDVKVQVEFNPTRVASYRLIGYENRLLKKEDFNNDAVDAGEIGAGHTVTAFYEIVPVGAEEKSDAAVAEVDELRYAPVAAAKTGLANPKVGGELLTVKLRYKEPAEETGRTLEFPLTDSGAKFANASTDFKFAAAVASFGMILRESPHKGTATFNDVVAWAESGSTDDAGGYRAEFIELARDAEKLER